MILFKTFYPLILIAPFLVAFILNQKQSFAQISPYSAENNFYNQLDHALKLTNLKTSSLNFDNFLNQIDFSVYPSQNKQPVQVKISSKKNPYKQIASLQEILKIAKINNKDVNFIDLSINHPYVSF